MPDLHSDEQLVAAFLTGDEAALNILIQRYTARVYNFVAQYIGHGQDAEDTTQETFIKVWKGLRRFDTTKKFKPWLFQIAKNTAIDFLRKRKLPILTTVVDDDENAINPVDVLSDQTPLPLEQMAVVERAAIIQKALNLLPNIYSTVINLYYLEELTLAEIAEVLSESLDTIKSRHRRALIKLRELIPKGEQ
ncbi:MAG: RNA polymerase sigma factor [Patescibacteria group bacterium]